MKLTRPLIGILSVLAGAHLANLAATGAEFTGLDVGLNNLYLVSKAQSRSVSPENFTGEKGKAGMATEGTGAACARDLGRGWKICPSVQIKAGETFTLCDIRQSGAIQHIWMTPTCWKSQAQVSRHTILRVYWDNEEHPNVECPVGDFFASAFTSFQTYRPLVSLPVCVNPGNAFNCYWEMPFRKHARITVENLSPDALNGFYYQITYTLTEVPETLAYLHAQWRRSNPVPYQQVHTLLDGVRGQGHYVGTYLAWGVNNNGWWGEGEIKFFMDGDREFPTICGTGTEDYFCGSYNFENRQTKLYQPFSTPYTGLAQVLPPDVAYVPGQRFGLYRWHITDPVRFDSDLRVTIQALGWQSGRRYLPLMDDIASTAFWYQMEPHAAFPKLPDKDHLEVN